MYIRRDLENLRKWVEKPRDLIQVVNGPRQVGKTTLVTQLLEKLEVRGIYVSADDTVAASGDWLDGVWQGARDSMIAGGENELVLVIDEIQKISNWSQYVKKNWDKDTLDRLNLKVIILGSSRLLLMNGLNESLMGRFFLHYIGHWSYAEMHEAFGFSPEQFVWFGGYPRAARFIDEEGVFKDYVKNAIIEPSISKDIVMLTQVNKPALLRQLFELASAYSGQILAFNKILGQLQEAGNASTLANYAELLGQASLVVGLTEHSNKLLKTKASSPKFQVYDMALMSSQRQVMFAEARADSQYWGRVVESAVGAHLLGLVRKNSLGELMYWRDGDVEVDFVMRFGDEVLAIEVKSGISDSAPENLVEFGRRFPQAKTLLIGDSGVRWQEFVKTERIEQLFGK